jgi:hypothetical protein
MSLHYRVVLPILIFTFLSGCSPSAPYRPSVSLGKSPVMIRAKARVEPFADLSPAEGKMWDAITSDTPRVVEPWSTMYLTRHITDAVVSDFSANNVFQEVGQNVNDPDIVIKGEVNGFRGKTKRNTLGWLTFPVEAMAPVSLLGIPVTASVGSVNITLKVYRRDGTLIGAYNGEGKFAESHSVYGGTSSAMRDRLDRAFTEAIEKIRTQLIADEQKFQIPSSR